MTVKSILTEEQQQLWAAVLAEVEELQAGEAGRSCSRSAAMVAADGQEVSCLLDGTQPDGSHRVFHVQANQYFGATTVKVDRYFHNADGYWEDQLADRTNAVVVAGRHYRIGPEPSAAELRHHPQRFGCGAAECRIRYFDGREVVTHNLWVQGVIPPVFRDRLPDDAEFIEPATRRPIPSVDEESMS